MNDSAIIHGSVVVGVLPVLVGLGLATRSAWQWFNSDDSCPPIFIPLSILTFAAWALLVGQCAMFAIAVN